MENRYLKGRRSFLTNSGVGLGQIAFASLLNKDLMAESKVKEAGLHHAPKAKRVIHLFMAGAPSQLEMFDYKAELAKLEGKPLPESVTKGQRLAFIQPDAAVLGPCFKFSRHGQSGAEISEVLPELAKVVDDIAIVKSVHTDQFNHSPAQIFFNTGSSIPGRASMGSWLSYGMGNEASDLPAYVVLKSGGSLSGGAAMWGSGYLPSEHQGVPFRESGDPILHVSNPKGIDMKSQRDALDLIREMNHKQYDVHQDPEVLTRVQAYEMAYRMQSRAPELMELEQENQATLDMYGVDLKKKTGFAYNALLARRLAERGVRFIQVYHSGWDHHSQVKNGVKKQCEETDKPIAALIKDLKQRGMLEDTLIVWGGEFGRTPMVEASAALGRSLGRDHHPNCFSMWFAGGGIKPGMTYGKTDPLGMSVVENPVHVHDVQATILHCLGIDHNRLTFRANGLNFKLTGVEHHKPVKAILA